MAFANVKTGTAIGVSSAYWAASIDNVPQGTSGSALAAGATSGMGTIKGITSFEITEPAAETIQIEGNNGVVDSFLIQSNVLPTGNLNVTVRDLDFYATARNLKNVAEQQWQGAGAIPECAEYTNLFMTLNCPMKSQDTATLSDQGFFVAHILKCQVDAKMLSGITSRQAHEIQNPFNINRSAYHPFGRAFVAGTDGSTKFGIWVETSSHAIAFQTIRGDGSTTAFDLAYTPNGTTANDVLGYNYTQASAYTTATDLTIASGTPWTATFSTPPTTNDVVVLKMKLAGSGC